MASSTSLASSLYVSHFLSTWNARGFEFGAVLFLATIYPNTLLPMSIYALVRALAAVAFSPSVGKFIDAGNRLTVIRISILGQRDAVAASCGIFLILFYQKDALPNSTRILLLTVLALLACVEKLCSIMNTVAVERDWVVVIANEDEARLQILNAQMRRIDLFCKLVAPLAVALLHGWSPNIAVWSTLGTNVISVGAEYFLIARVFNRVPELAERRGPSAVGNDDLDGIELSSEQAQPSAGNSFFARYLAPVVHPLNIYVRQTAFLPSFSLCMLHLTVLSFAGQMTTFLLAVPQPKITSTTVGVLRTIATVSELSATFLAPRIMSQIGPVRSGIWFLSWQLTWLTCAVGILWFDLPASPRAAVPIFVSGVILSRSGLWSFDLCAQQMIQESITASHRGTFSSVEMSLQNFFELCAFATTIIFPRPNQFGYPALVSLVALYCSAVLYAKFVRDRRGHLLHMPSCLKKAREHQYQSLSSSEID
ncbi:Ferroporti-1 [Exophiala viscosa]|uniref:Solute carrier family 40 member n=1 Tax=Exophiala viscosa TaxID=2486360 RepID=A0AAN6E742_9EURO|nr:Ferroporti-1 [Exophiala viscosa]